MRKIILILFFFLVSNTFANEYESFRKENCLNKILRDCDKILQKIIISTIPSVVSLKKDKLQIKILNGEIKSFEDNRYLLYHFKDETLLVVSNIETEYSTENYSLLNYKTGQEYKIKGVPLFSPKRNKFSTYNSINPIMSGLNYFEVWKKGSDMNFKKIWEHKVKDDGFHDVTWINEFKIHGLLVKQIAPTRGPNFSISKSSKWIFKILN